MRYKMEELLPLAGRLAERYTAYESTSVTYEKAEQLMGAVLYCIREGEEADRGLPSAGNSLPAKEAYERGLRAVRQKTRDALNLYHTLLPDFCAYGNTFLYDTVVKGLPEFFRWYDTEFCPQDTILTLDYPVEQDLSGCCGVDKIWKYIRCILLEQQYLARFSQQYVIEMLKEWNPSYMDTPVNLCEAFRSAVDRPRTL